MCSGRCVVGHHRTATTACYILTVGVQVEGWCSYSTTILALELCAIKLALEFLLHCLHLSNVVILSHSRGVLVSLNNSVKTRPLDREVLESCKAVIDCGWTLHIQWISSHLAVPGNEIVNQLAARARGDDSLTIRVHLSVKARSLIRHFFPSIIPMIVSLLRTAYHLSLTATYRVPTHLDYIVSELTQHLQEPSYHASTGSQMTSVPPMVPRAILNKHCWSSVHMTQNGMVCSLLSEQAVFPTALHSFPWWSSMFRTPLFPLFALTSLSFSSFFSNLQPNPIFPIITLINFHFIIYAPYGFTHS